MYFFILAALSFLVGIICNRMIRDGINGLSREAEGIDHTASLFFKQMKLKYENCLKMGHEINNTEAFAAKYLEKYRWHGLAIKSLEKLSAYAAGMCVVFAVCGALMDRERLVEYLLIGFLAMYVIAGSKKIIDVPGKTRKITLDVVDYFENRYFAATVEKDIVPEKTGESSAQEKNISHKQFSDEEKKLIDEILREYLG